MKDGPNRTDHMVMTAMEIDFENIRTPGNEEKILRKCACGWEKVTTFRGVRIHQGKVKCGQNGQQQPCTATAGETRGTKRQGKNHRANGPNVAGGMRTTEEEGPLVANEPVREHEDPVLTTSDRTEPNAETKKPARRSKIKWPKSSEPEAWRALDADLIKTLEELLHGGVEAKLNLIGDIIYQTCKDRFGELVPRQRTTLGKKTRREKEILQLVQRRRQLRKNWRKATQAEKEGLKALWEEVRKRLAGLRRAERIRKRNRRKEKERASFFKDPFKHARQLLEEKKTGKLEITREQLEQHVREQYSDPQRSVPLGTPGHVPQPAQPTAEFNTKPPKISEIQKAKREKTDLHVIWLDLANAYGSVPHQLINYAMDFFHMPTCVKILVAEYFNNLQMCFSAQDFITGWQRLEVGIAMGCAISPVLFVAAFEIILIGARQMVGGIKLPNGQRLPPLRSYMDDITTLLQTAACTSRLLKRMDELMSWARMKIKPSKSRSLSLRRGVRNDRTTFVVGGEKIPLLAEQAIRSLGRQYTAELSDKHMGKTVMKQLCDGLARIDQSQLPGKYKVWCYQFTLYRRVMWPLKMSEIPSSTVSKMDGKANSFIRKWLGLPRCLSEAGLFGRNMLQLPLKSLQLGYMQEKARLVLELRESTDRSVRNANIGVLTGRKWNAQTKVDQAISRLQHQEIVGRVQVGRAGLGWGDVPHFWSKANRKERKEMVVAEVLHAIMDHLSYTIKNGIFV
ncbi:hypothetical protein MHYP_G00001650 [Metynnis hypsauchen]